jgi:hypothetical protein
MIKLFSLALILITFNAHSYPVFFRCDKNGVMNDFESSADLQKSLTQMKDLSSEEIDDLAQDFCKGSEECLARLKQAGMLSKMSHEVVSKYYQDELLKLDANSPGTPVPESNVILLRKLKSMKELIACRSAHQKIKSPNDENVKFSYPFYSNYMFTTGCKSMSGDYCNSTTKEEVRKVVEKSLLAGVDPYLFMALSLQENGPGSPDALYLDPIGIIKAMGCDSKTTAASSDSFESFGTYHKVESGVIRRPDVSAYFESKLSDNRIKKEKSFLCSDVKNSSKISVNNKAQKNACCLELPYALDVDDAKKGLVPFYIKDMQSKPIPFNQKDPAFTVQLYNGFSNFMGAAEGVPVFRSGLNFFQEPSYGYQGMDFILNSLLLNKDLKDIIEQEQKKLGKASPSILCKGKNEGYHSIDSDYYFNKHKNSNRMGLIAEKFRQGKGYESLTERERKVFDKEMRSPKVLEKFGLTNLFSDSSFKTLKKTLDDDEISKDDFYNGYVDKDTFKKNTSKYGLTPEALDYFYEYSLLDAQISHSVTDAETVMRYDVVDEEKAEDYLKKNFKMATGKDIENMTSFSPEKKIKVLNSLGVRIDEENGEKDINAAWILAKNNLATLAQTKLREKNKLTVTKYTDNDFVSAALEGAFYKRKPIEEIVKASFKPNEIEQTKKLIESYFEQIDAAKEKRVIDPYKYFKPYFKDVYKERDSVGKASDYPWRRFTDEEVETLSNKPQF